MPKTIAAEMMEQLEQARDTHCAACGCEKLRMLSSTELWCGGCGTIGVVGRGDDGRPTVSWNIRAKPPF